VAATSTAPNSATVTWTASADNTAVTSYTITRGSIVTTVSGTATSYTDVTTASATAYTYTVTALDAAGNPSAASTPATVTTAAGPLDTVKPTVPAGLTATPAPTEIDLAWTAATDDAAVAGYKILRDGTLIATTYSTSYSDTGLAAGIAHSYTVSTFDGAGNTSDPSTSAMAAAAAAPPASVAYAYDIADRLISITTASGTATVFTIDPLGRHASQTIGTAPTATYSYLGTTDIVVSIAAGSGTTTSAIDALGDRVAVSAAGTGGFLLPDLHGNTAGALNSTASSITDAFAYDAYGNTVAAVTSGLPTPWRYQGRMLESAAGSADLYDFGSRSYSPSIGTFTSLDSKHGSAGNPALLNGYLYANANPATLVDPDGHAARFMYDDNGRRGVNQAFITYDDYMKLGAKQTGYALKYGRRALDFLANDPDHATNNPAVWYMADQYRAITDPLGVREHSTFSLLSFSSLMRNYQDAGDRGDMSKIALFGLPMAGFCGFTDSTHAGPRLDLGKGDVESGDFGSVDAWAYKESVRFGGEGYDDSMADLGWIGESASRGDTFTDANGTVFTKSDLKNLSADMAQGHAALGVDEMKYSDAQREAITGKPYLKQMYYGSNIHTETGLGLKQELGKERVSYNASNGPDFSFTMDDGSIYQVELSTETGLNAHKSKYNGITNIDYATYSPPWAK